MRKTQPKRIVPPAGLFETNAFYERVLELRRTNPAAFASLAPVTKRALGHYEADRVKGRKS